MVFVYITIALAVGVAGGWFLNKFIVTKRLGDADTLARRIVLEARKEAQAQKKEIILQGKDDLFNQKREQENEFRDREREIKARERKLEDFGTRLEEKAERRQPGNRSSLSRKRSLPAGSVSWKRARPICTAALRSRNTSLWKLPG